MKIPVLIVLPVLTILPYLMMNHSAGHSLIPVYCTSYLFLVTFPDHHFLSTFQYLPELCHSFVPLLSFELESEQPDMHLFYQHHLFFFSSTASGVQSLGIEVFI